MNNLESIPFQAEQIESETLMSVTSTRYKFF